MANVSTHQLKPLEYSSENFRLYRFSLCHLSNALMIIFPCRKKNCKLLHVWKLLSKESLNVRITLNHSTKSDKNNEYLPSPEQSLSPFQFYADMRHNNPVAYDDRNNIWDVFRYYDVQFILGDYIHFSSAVPPTKLNNLSKEVNEEEDQKIPSSRPSLLKSDPPIS